MENNYLKEILRKYSPPKEYCGDVLSVFQTPGLLTNLEPDQPGVCTVGRGGERGSP